MKRMIGEAIGEPIRRMTGETDGRTAGEFKSEQGANKIFFGIPICTYKARRDNKRKEFEDFWEAKRGLTRCDIESSQVQALRSKLSAHQLSAVSFQFSGLQRPGCAEAIRGLYPPNLHPNPGTGPRGGVRVPALAKNARTGTHRLGSVSSSKAGPPGIPSIILLRLRENRRNPLWANESVDLIGRTESPDAGSGPDGDTVERAVNLDPPFAVGVPAINVVGQVEGPDTIPTSGDLAGP